MRNKLLVEKIRLACIENNWFTDGDNEEYQILFDMVLTGENINNIAFEICAFSNDTYTNIRKILVEIYDSVEKIYPVLANLNF